MSFYTLRIVRRDFSDTQTTGTFACFDDKDCIIKDDLGEVEGVTMELPWKDNKRQQSCIPPDEYWVEIRDGAAVGSKFKYLHFHIKDVPNRDWILIHIANFVRQLLGCIAPGMSLADIDGDGNIDVTNSQKALERIVACMPEKFKLIIV